MGQFSVIILYSLFLITEKEKNRQKKRREQKQEVTTNTSIAGEVPWFRSVFQDWMMTFCQSMIVKVPHMHDG